jgi:hypothetical protein
MILPGLSCIFREVPSVTPGASIGAKLLWRVGGRDLVCSRRESFTLGCVLPLSADGAFRFVFHHSPAFCEFFQQPRSARNPQQKMRHGVGFWQVICILSLRSKYSRIQDLRKHVSSLGDKCCDSAGDAGSSKSDASVS